MAKSINSLAKKYGIVMEDNESSVVERSLSKNKLLQTRKIFITATSEIDVAKASVDAISHSIEQGLTELTNTHKNSENEEALELLNSMMSECRDITAKLYALGRHFQDN